MKIENIKITIKSLEKSTDRDGATYLKAKGWCNEKINGNKTISYFTTISLYGTHELLEETQHRLFSQVDDDGLLLAKPRLKLEVYYADLSLPIAYNKNNAFLKVYYYDFETKKFGTKKIMRSDAKALLEQK